MLCHRQFSGCSGLHDSGPNSGFQLESDFHTGAAADQILRISAGRIQKAPERRGWHYFFSLQGSARWQSVVGGNAERPSRREWTLHGYAGLGQCRRSAVELVQFGRGTLDQHAGFRSRRVRPGAAAKRPLCFESGGRRNLRWIACLRVHPRKSRRSRCSCGFAGQFRRGRKTCACDGHRKWHKEFRPALDRNRDAGQLDDLRDWRQSWLRYENTAS